MLVHNYQPSSMLLLIIVVEITAVPTYFRRNYCETDAFSSTSLRDRRISVEINVKPTYFVEISVKPTYFVEITAQPTYFRGKYGETIIFVETNVFASKLRRSQLIFVEITARPTYFH